MEYKIKCNRCKCNRLPIEFVSNNKTLKCCEKCRVTANNYFRKWNISNPERARQTQRDWVRNNPEKVKANQLKFAESHPNYQAEFRKNMQLETPLLVKSKKMITNSKTRDAHYGLEYKNDDYINVEFLLNLYDIQDGICYYEDCACDLSLEFNATKRDPMQISIQRLDNKIAHIQSNCVFSCFRCNVTHKEHTNP
tara:strand:+ start:1910 stop:2494 length:585 start_codon:yes stop_codon:yes gene_type:complete